ncbi:hypothetical protein RJJ37_29480 [Rhizobium redzepovicii]|uniref:PhoD-like phosphatase metallophosphatase domain-containing protein n=1 Tax=Rhizobium redzepovicii TaxID=2867518 RepID=A0AAW8P9M3_9HYPH|nr:hypothetical protein [Rhizobium redzepovicii]MDR9763713.1 hypothetical protein [Rhizobium redzepovicii]
MLLSTNAWRGKRHNSNGRQRVGFEIEISASQTQCPYFSGDQIYADDVPDLAFGAIQELGIELTGKSRIDLLTNAYSKYSKGGSRGALVEDRGIWRNRTGFTVNIGTGGNHLINFDEFAAAYCMAWNPRLWQGEGGLHEQLRKKPKTPPTELFAKEKRRELELESEKLLSFYSSVQSFSRLVANISTYMFFDDHEVTDDWNLTVDWAQRVAASELGSSIVRNGILGYWAFQDRGNRAPDEKDSLTGVVSEYFSSHGKNAKALDLALSKRSWSFCSATAPLITFLDTRTKRVKAEERIQTYLSDDSLASLSAGSNTALVSTEEITKLTSEISDTPERPIIIVTPTPIFSCMAIEGIKESVSSTTRDIHPLPSEFVDAEHWLANPKSFLNACTLLSALGEKQVLILSGDVHFSFALSAKIRFRGGDDIQIIQVTSSAVQNEQPPPLKALLEMFGTTWGEHRNSFSFWFRDGQDPVFFSDLHNKEAQYDRLKMVLGIPTIECFSSLEPLHEPLPAIGPLSAPQRAIETRNTVGFLQFFGNEGQHQLLTNLPNGTLRSRPLFFRLSAK